MNVLVTGGAGFIGNHTVRYLIEKGYDVTVVDDLSRGNAGLLPLEAHFYPIDILTPQFQEFMAARHFDAVIHLAAQIEVASSERDPLRDASLNIGGTLAVLEGARKAHVSRFVFASSAARLWSSVRSTPAAGGRSAFMSAVSLWIEQGDGRKLYPYAGTFFFYGMGDSSLCQCIWRAGSP